MLQVKIEKQLPDFKLNVNFETGAEILVLFGASGAGKTMTLNCIAGLLAPAAGAIRFNGAVLFDSAARVNLPARLRRVGYVFQHYALFPHLTVRENVAFGAKGRESTKGRESAKGRESTKGRESAKGRETKGHESPKGRESARVDELLELVGLTSLATRHPSHLSGGQQQRVALARALAPHPDLLLLDEPFSALDAPTRETLRQELRALQSRFNLPTIFVTHDLGEAYFLADKLAVMDRGEIVQIGAPGEILLRPRDLRVARAVGVKNILRGVVEARDEKMCRVRVGQFVLETPASSAPVGAEVNVCIRAERVVLMRPERGEESRAENVLEGELLREASDGSTVTLYFRADAPRLAPNQEFDLQIELPVYIYERLDLARTRRWRVSVRRNGIHLIR